jgi:hypothetical protein
VYKDNNETYASIASFHNTSQDSYVRGYQPTYAQPIPKNLRPQHIYSNAAVIARHSPQPLALSPQNSQSSADGSRGTVTIKHKVFDSDINEKVEELKYKKEMLKDINNKINSYKEEIINVSKK